jgi:GT2 family glycosyltransferase
MSTSSESCLPKVSVISIALKPEEFEPVLANLSRQTFRDYEFIGEAGGSIPAAWNRAIRRARGEFLVFTETDATPVDEHWLGEMVVALTGEKDIVKGLEVTGISWDLCNLAAPRCVFMEHPFDDTFGYAADKELLSRLKSQGIHLISPRQAPVIHVKKSSHQHNIRRAFLNGLYWVRLHQRYSDPVELAKVGHASKLLKVALLNLLGLVIGWVIYLPGRYFRKGSKVIHSL